MPYCAASKASWRRGGDAATIVVSQGSTLPISMVNSYDATIRPSSAGGCDDREDGAFGQPRAGPMPQDFYLVVGARSIVGRATEGNDSSVIRASGPCRQVSHRQFRGRGRYPIQR